MTAPDQVRRPDVEALVVQVLAHLPGTTSFCYMATTETPRWVTTYSIQVDSRAASKKLAADLAEDTRLVMVALHASDWPGGVVSAVTVTEGPFWLPDADGGPRYSTRYEVRAHPRRGVIPAAPAGHGHRGHGATREEQPA